MGNGDYISKLVSGIRGEFTPPGDKTNSTSENQNADANHLDKTDVNSLLKSIIDFEVKGNAKRLIRMDARNEDVLKHLKYLFGVDVTSFVNFLCWQFLENNPELVNEVRQSLKQLEL